MNNRAQLSVSLFLVQALPPWVTATGATLARMQLVKAFEDKRKWEAQGHDSDPTAGQMLNQVQHSCGHVTCYDSCAWGPCVSLLRCSAIHSPVVHVLHAAEPCCSCVLQVQACDLIVVFHCALRLLSSHHIVHASFPCRPPRW